MNIPDFSPNIGNKKTFFMIQCEAESADNCLKKHKLTKEAIVKNIKRNGKYICHPCSLCNIRQKRLEEKGVDKKHSIIFKPLNYSSKVGTCENKDHDSRRRCISPIYPFEKDRIPIEDFVNHSNPENPFKYCLGCRTYRIQEREKMKESLKLKDDNESDYQTCLSDCHLTASKLQRDKVPKEKFIKNLNDPKSEKCKYCIDCRQYNVQITKDLLEKRIKEKQESGINFCSLCLAVKNESQMGINKDGTMSCYCKYCKERSNELAIKHYYELRKHFRQLQLEIILKNECSCNICKCIFLKPIGEENIPIRIQTIYENGENYIHYNNKKYLVKDFLTEFQDLLEFRILDFDHLPLYNKIANVSDMQSKGGMSNESEKCQLIDCLCHVIVTREREKQNSSKSDRNISEKLKYVNSLKDKGCSCCGILPQDSDYRFIHMDHIDRDTKIENIAQMVFSEKFSLKDVIEECEKCRPLCAFCHRIRTSKQLNLYPECELKIESFQI